MRRAKQREMEAMQNCNDNALPTKFLTKVLEIPVVKFGVNHATGFYTKVKDFNTITHKSFELAETVTGAVVGRVTPLAQKGICMAAQPLHKIDDLAAQGLQTLEDKVPVINKEPQAMVSDVTGAVTEKLIATKDRVTKASEGVLVSRPVQTYFDLLEFVLKKANYTLDKVLPPSDNEEDQRKGSKPGDDQKAERGWYLLGQFFGLLNTAKNRVVRKVRHRIESTSNAADAVFNEAKKAVNHALPVAVDKDMKETTNGDSKTSGHKGKKRGRDQQHGDLN